MSGTHDSSHLIGSKLADYKILERLGAGGMGEVFLAQDSRLGRKVAVKLLAAEYTGDEDRMRRFENEARTASALNHPNIVTIHDLGEAEAGRYIVMEFVEGRTLRSLIVERPAMQVILRVAAQIAEGMAVAHEADVVHRDIKPENVMLREDGYVKLVDFGLVRLLPSRLPRTDNDTESLAATDVLTGPDMVLGTAAYMSPEQARGESVDSATDLFSLGIVLYELATGHHPFRADSRIGVLHGIIADTPIPPSRLNAECPGVLEAIILRLLEKDSRLRPTAAEVARQLAQLASGGSQETPSRAAAAPQSQTVGRATDLEKLNAGLQTASAGQGAFLCVSGEAGIGKTTLVEEFLDGVGAREADCRIARGRCSERLAGTEAFLPFLEALESLLASESRDVVARPMKLLAPTWYVQMGPLSSDESSLEQLLSDTKIGSQERLKRELVAFLSDLCRAQTLVLSFDDLHWADVATVDLLAYVAARMKGLRLLMVATVRPTDLILGDHPFLRVKLDLQSRGICREIPLEFLTSADIEKYLALQFPEHQFPDELARLIHRKSDGSPLFIVDLVRWLRDREIIRRDGDRWTLAESLPDLERDLPESVRSMIERKIEQLTDEDRRLLTVASVQGGEFDAAVVAQVLEADPADVEERLEFLDRVHSFVRPIGEHEFPDSTLTVRFAFVHGLYQNVLYATLTPSRRASLCAKTADAIRDFHRNEHALVAAELAILYESARDFVRASDFFLTAARNTARLHATEEAIELAGRALAGAERIDGERRAVRVMAACYHRATFLVTVTRFAEAISDLEVAVQVAEELGDADAQARALCGVAMVRFAQKDLTAMRELGTRALEMARESGTEVGVAAAQSVLANERMCSGDLPAAEEYFDAAAPVLLAKDFPLHTLDAVSYRGLLHTWRLEYDETEQVAKCAEPIARNIGMGFHILQILFYRGMAAGNQGRLADALELLDEGRRLAELNGDRYWLPRLPNTIGWLHREMADMDMALRLDTESIEMAHAHDFAEAEANACVNLGHDYLVLGEPDRAIEYLERAQRIYGEDVWYRWRYNIRMQAELAAYWIARGDTKLAASHAAACLESAESTSSNKYRAWSRKLLGDVAVLEDRVVEAARYFDESLSILGDYACPFVEWRVLKAAADLARATHDEASADRFTGRARAVVKSLADSLGDKKLRETFLASRDVEGLG